MPLNRIQTLKAFFEEDSRPLTMEEMKALPKPDRISLADLARAEMVRRGSHKDSDFDFSETK